MRKGLKGIIGEVLVIGNQIIWEDLELLLYNEHCILDGHALGKEAKPLTCIV